MRSISVHRVTARIAAVTLLVQFGTLGHGPSAPCLLVRSRRRVVLPEVLCVARGLQAPGDVVRPKATERDRVDESIEMVDGELTDIASCRVRALQRKPGRDR